MASSPDPGVPLAHYRQHGAGVLLICAGCLFCRTFALDPIIRRLEARGVGDERTGIRALAGLVREPCPVCASRSFETRPDFPAPQQDPEIVYVGRRGSDQERSALAPT